MALFMPVFFGVAGIAIDLKVLGDPRLLGLALLLTEAADGVTRESEDRTWLSVLRPVRQDPPGRYPGACLRAVPLEQGRAWR